MIDRNAQVSDTPDRDPGSGGRTPTYREANQRYRRAFFPVIAVYACLAFAAPAVLRLLGDGDVLASPLPLRIAAGVLCGAPLIGVFVLMWRLCVETDEFTRAQHLKAFTIGGMAAASFAATWGFLELFGAAPALWTFLLAPLFFGAYGLAYWRISGRCPDEALFTGCK
ncbi:hypothetical protein GC169_05700 [bacterium]|nr:hypothetical protein [bacterium]